MTNVCIPINIALVLKGEGATFVNDLNRQLVESGNQDIVLGEERNLPHVTLAMLVVHKEDLKYLRGLMNQIDVPDSLFMSSIYSVERKNGTLCAIQVELTKELELCHQAVLSVVRQFPIQRAERSMFPEKVGDSIVDYVNSFDKYSGQHYSPHITLGYGPKPSLFRSGHVNVSLKLCLIGDHGVCHAIIADS